MLFFRPLLSMALLSGFVFQAMPAAAQFQEKAVNAAQLRAYLTFFADDSMEGRDTPSRGLDTAANFIAALLSRWGVLPAGDSGTYFQTITYRRDTAAPEKSKLALGETTFTAGEDFVPTPRENGLAGTARGAMVYVNYGLLFKPKGIDDLADSDVRGKIVVANLASGFSLPYGITRQEQRQATGADFQRVTQNAKNKGAVGVVLILSKSGYENWKTTAETYRRGTMELEKEMAPGLLPVVLVGEKAARAIFAGEKHDLEAVWASIEKREKLPTFALSESKVLTLETAFTSERQKTQNVAALIEGSDKKLMNEVVALTAHYDHVGRNTRAQEGADAIYNGADDNGSGSVALLAIAEAMSQSRRKPKRSVLFLWFTGEEKGLRGSAFYCDYPTIPLDRFAALINIDMIGRSRAEGDTSRVNQSLTGPNEVYVSGPALMSSALEKVSKNTNDRYLKLTYNPRYDNLQDPSRIFFRSDHVHFARKGIPSMFYFTGTHADYHRVSDHVDKIDFPKMERITRTIYKTLVELANLRERPKVDKPTPPELQARTE